MARLATHVWVGAYLRRLAAETVPVYVAARGDATAGAVLIKVATLDGQAAAWQRSYDFERDARIWMELARGAEAEVDRAVAAQRRTDPDLWVLEVEDRQGRHFLDQPGFE